MKSADNGCPTTIFIKWRTMRICLKWTSKQVNDVCQWKLAMHLFNKGVLLDFKQIDQFKKTYRFLADDPKSMLIFNWTPNAPKRGWTFFSWPQHSNCKLFWSIFPNYVRNLVEPPWQRLAATFPTGLSDGQKMFENSRADTWIWYHPVTDILVRF